MAAVHERIPSLTVEHLRAGYGKRAVLRDVSFRVDGGMLTGLLGANGCGKTTLLKVLCRQLPYAGSCLMEDTHLNALPRKALARQVSYIPQRSGISISLPVLQVVLMGFNPVLGLLERPSEAQRGQALEALGAVGMADRADEDFQRLSEGQKQLCILARTMVEDARLLLMDEPESSLDFFHRHRIMRLLSGLIAGTGKACLVTLHDPALALAYCQRLILLKNGVCAAVLHPESDSLSHMEAALTDVYGPVRLARLENRLVMLPADESEGGAYAPNNPRISS